MGILGKIYEKLFLSRDADWKQIQLMKEQVGLKMEQDMLKDKLRKAEQQLKEDLKAAKGDSKKEAAAYRKCREAYKNSNYKEFEKKKKELLHREVMNHSWDRID